MRFGQGLLRPSSFHVVGAVLALVVGYLAAGGPIRPGAGSAAPVGLDVSPSAAARTPGASTTSAAAAPRPTGPPPTAPAGAATSGLVTARGDVAWLWLGDVACPGGTESGRLARSTDGGATWQEVTAPGQVLSGLDSASDRRVTATVLDQACGASVVTSDDGGVTWDTLDSSGSLAAVALGEPDGIWALRGAEVVHDDGGAFAPAAAQPCAEDGAGPAALVEAVSAAEAYVVCQTPDGAGRLLTRTRDSGVAWTRLAGRRAESGLAGPGAVAGLSFGDRDRGVALLRGAACAGGELRVTANSGALWRALPCVAVDGTPAIEVLSVAALGGGGLLALARTASGAQLLLSGDGSTWRAGSV